MRYAILTHPDCGRTTVEQKRSALAKAATILQANIYGLDTFNREEFKTCVQDLAQRCAVIVVAGGDGTFSDVINAVDTSQIAVAYLPLGTGNAMGYALGYKGGLDAIAKRIKQGRIREYDLINCEEKYRAFTVSIGIDGDVIRLRDRYVARGYTGFKAYFRAVWNVSLQARQRTGATVELDGKRFEIPNLLSLMVVKHPFYGFGMNVVPNARFDDGRLHICWIGPGLFRLAVGGVSAFTIGNRIGDYYTGRTLHVRLDRPLGIQLDGNAGWDASVFDFAVLPKVLKIKC